MFKYISLVIFTVVILGLAIPQNLQMPVEGANGKDYNKDTFWHYPWGKSVTHKGIDIFAREGTPVISATHGVVLLCTQYGMGGNIILILGPKWRLHYYAHLKDIQTKTGSLVSRGEKIGTVGKTGNAVNTPAHLHYAIGTLIPYPWRIDKDRQGWMKMFYLNPVDYLDK
ncbi:peptidase family M23 [Bacteroidales bacterium 6E]|nr:peptidase family M23 [Bacteroidales bacterium 6E]